MFGIDDRWRDRLKDAVRRRGTQAEVSANAQVPLRTLQSWVNGRATPSIEDAAKVAQVVGVSLDWLAYGENNASSPPALEDAVDKHIATAIDRMETHRAVPQDALDESLLQTAIEAVEMHLAERGKALAPARKSALISMLYAGARQPDPGSAKAIDPVAARRLFRLIE